MFLHFWGPGLHFESHLWFYSAYQRTDLLMTITPLKFNPVDIPVHSFFWRDYITAQPQVFNKDHGLVNWNQRQNVSPPPPIKKKRPQSLAWRILVDFIQCVLKVSHVVLVRQAVGSRRHGHSRRDPVVVVVGTRLEGIPEVVVWEKSRVVLGKG